MIGIFTDLETDKIIKGFSTEKDITDLKNYPCILEVGFMVYDYTQKQVLATYSQLVKADFKIRPRPPHLANITDDILQRHGIPIDEALDVLGDWINKVDFWVGHNPEFDIKIYQAECYRRGRNVPNIENALDTKKLAKIIGIGVDKKHGANLGDMVKYLGVKQRAAHIALNDALMCFDSFNVIMHNAGFTLEDLIKKTEAYIVNLEII